MTKSVKQCQDCWTRESLNRSRCVTELLFHNHHCIFSSPTRVSKDSRVEAAGGDKLRVFQGNI
ncbi:hypothetical protein LR48_Vigan10g211700 [Vigna angularis]|uniref:Uncharacterized protein n=1 Tax=Phaseolus angularis TaxID=3914 RepID=A0A0L9VME8_PHAAN|nr:hypothetical protein LR48_Vigan10g211700 [Vigna angularis]